jgi:hypothetical protein
MRFEFLGRCAYLGCNSLLCGKCSKQVHRFWIEYGATEWSQNMGRNQMVCQPTSRPSFTSGCLFICMEVLRPHVHYFFLPINNPEDCEILINNLLQLVRLHEKFTEDRIHAHLPARGWRASFFKWKDTRANGVLASIMLHQGVLEV